MLVLDEPFSGLDPTAVDVMSRVLRETADTGAPVVFSSHQLDLVERLCDRVGIISQGHMVAEGTVNELRSTEHQQACHCGGQRSAVGAAGTSPAWHHASR